MEISGDKIKGYLYIGGAVLIVGLALWIWGWINKFRTQPGAFQDFANTHPNTAAFLTTVGVTAPGGQKPDTTGTTGANIASQSQTITYSSSQGDYDTLLAAYATNNGFDTSLDAQGSKGWPWTSYQDWVNQGYPQLPGGTASSSASFSTILARFFGG